MERLVVVIFCLLASCYLDVTSSGSMPGESDAGEEREADAAIRELEDAAVRGLAQASAHDAGAGARVGEDGAASDAAVDSGAPVSHGDAARGAEPVVSTAFALTSPAFRDGARLPDTCTCWAGDRSPPLHWVNPPAGTRSFALVLTATRSASARPNVEWVVWGLAADSRMLPEGVAAGREPSNVAGAHQDGLSELERAALDLGVPGAADGLPLGPSALSPVALPSPLDLVRRPRYRGPCEEQGVHYEFTLFALDVEPSSDWDAFVSLEAVEQWLKTRRGALGEASLVATYP